MDLASIRNFCLIAHIDHGKSTLADRFIQLCGGLSEREMSTQVLDSMELERERGITIKAQCVALDYRALDGCDYRLNLIDTPGHVDFSYEVSRSLAACEGALLLVDASQGVEAQSVANCHTAVEQGLTVLPVLNKMDLDAVEPELVLRQIEEIIGLDTDPHCRISAKTGADVRSVLERVVHSVPPPLGDPQGKLQALIIDSWFDRYLGVVSLVRVVHGSLRCDDRITVVSTGIAYRVEQLGRFRPRREFADRLGAGEVGFVIAGVKDIHAMPVGDTLVADADTLALPGFRRASPRVYAGLYPLETDQFEAFREALGRLALNDAALRYEPSSSEALGPGFRCGFLGLLHMEIVQARLEREYALELIATAPNVAYRITATNGEELHVINPADMPDPARIVDSFEPMVRASILSPRDYLGALLELCVRRRGVQQSLQYAGDQVCLEFRLPMSEVILDFHDRLKSLSRGFASLDYSVDGYQPAPLARVDVLLNGERLDALAAVVHRSQVQQRGRQLVARMKELLPRQMFDIAVQAVVGSRVIARQTVRARRKNVTAKCYGGDVSRKKKLLEKQRAGKRRMKKLGRVDVPQEAFMALLRIDHLPK